MSPASRPRSTARSGSAPRPNCAPGTPPPPCPDRCRPKPGRIRPPGKSPATQQEPPSRAASFLSRTEPSMQILAYLLARFSEPSSYAGLGALLALLGWNLPDGALADLVQLCAAASALAALFLKERGLIRAIVLVFAV